MMETVRACKEHNVAVGAHPGLPDLQGFGRREMKLDPAELTAITIYQVGALQGFLSREDVPLHHVKPHGVLYGMMCRDYEVAKAVMLGIPKGVPVFGLAGTEMERAASDLGLEFWAEMYGDVKYNKDGMLVIDRKKKYVGSSISFETLCYSYNVLALCGFSYPFTDPSAILQALETRRRRQTRYATAHNRVRNRRRWEQRPPARQRLPDIGVLSFRLARLRRHHQNNQRCD